jgi:N-acetylglucosaminyldiphosphoundecaprenol N-acetyl-beta-D-mannosaminyltransferase
MKLADSVMDAVSAPAAPPRDVPPRPELPMINLHGVDLHAVDEKTAIQHILDELEYGRGGSVVTPNLDHLRRVRDDLHFGALVAEADLVVADGMPLIWASRLQGTPLPGRVAGSDLIWSLSSAAAGRGRSIFLLGGDPGTAEAAGKTLCEKYPSLRIAGTYCPPPGFEKSNTEMAAMINTLVEAQPDIVFVALGSPKQELLIDRIKKTLPHAWWLGVGISFSFVCGHVKRAPIILQTLGLEWVHRLVQEPRRLFKRYIVIGIPFGVSLMSAAATRRLGGFFRSAPKSRRREILRYSNNNGKSHVAELVSAIAATTPAIEHELRVAEPVVRSSNGDGISSRKLNRLRAVVLLGGSVRQTELATAIGRSVLDLPVDENGSLLNHWLSHVAELSQYAGVDALPVRVLVNRKSPEPVSTSARYANICRVERDSSEFRGTGGVLRDLAESYDDNDLILVANAGQVLMDPLSVIAAALDHKRADIALISHRDGTPSGVQLIRVKTLRGINPVGYVDLKEQALPQIATSFDVKVMHCRRPSGLPIRSLEDYIAALRYFHRRKHGKPAINDALAEDWHPSFGIVEEGAMVDSRAHVHDSVVLRGAVVEADASVVRCVVCPGGQVKSKATLVDQLIKSGR